MSPEETRVALVEAGQIRELFTERVKEKGLAGNIYKGRVMRVLPGMQAAFLDLGLEKAAFLYVDDIVRDHPVYDLDLIDEGERLGVAELDEDAAAPEGAAGDEDDEDENGGNGKPAAAEPRKERPKRPTSRRQAAPNQSIEELIKPGQELLVQIAKEPMGTKGARITSHISLPGRYLVFMPTIDTVGISRRIGEEKDRKRLRRLVQAMKPEGTGFIVRTAAAIKTDEEIEADILGLLRTWKRIQEKFASSKAPAAIHEELDLGERILRDTLNESVTRIIVDDKEEYERIVDHLADVGASTVEALLYQEREALFDRYGVEIDIHEALSRKVWLPSGGYLIIEQTEALTAIDVNTGKFVGKRNQEETILKTNLEAVEEIVHQLRLRNIGGIIILDLIDMEIADNRERVYRALNDAMRRDKARSTVSRISELGLIEMTRKRTRESLAHQLCEPCPYCEGRGIIKSRESIAYEILRDLRRELRGKRRQKYKLRVHPLIAETFENGEEASLRAIETKMNKKIEIEAVPKFHHEQYEIL
ncbi:MAG: Rne/Rng family ribonuclease [Myxococcales bacterium]|nr:Rne/Rng family ribonuclease [Myxococcales bacterium]